MQSNVSPHVNRHATNSPPLDSTKCHDDFEIDSRVEYAGLIGAGHTGQQPGRVEGQEGEGRGGGGYCWVERERDAA